MKKSEKSRIRGTNPSGMKGITTVELVIVVAIILIAGALVVPNLMQSWYDLELRAAAAQVSDLMQQTRMIAAKKNTVYPVRFQVNNGVQQAYIDLNLDGTLDVGDPRVDFPRLITAAAGAPTGSPQPTPYVLVGDTTTGTPYTNTNILAFSSRGLPCNYDTTTSPPTCTTPSASYFVYYFQDNRPNGWSAVVVTKAGRTKVITWNGTSWN